MWKLWTGLLRMTLWVRTSSLYKQQPLSLSFFFRLYWSCHSYLGTPPSLKRKASVSKNQSTRKDWHFGVTSFICNPDQLSVATSDIQVGLLWPLAIGRSSGSDTFQEVPVNVLRHNCAQQEVTGVQCPEATCSLHTDPRQAPTQFLLMRSWETWVPGCLSNAIKFLIVLRCPTISSRGVFSGRCCSLGMPHVYSCSLDQTHSVNWRYKFLILSLQMYFSSCGRAHRLHFPKTL